MRPAMFLVPVLAVASASAAGADLSAACKPVMAAMEKTILIDHATTTTHGTQTMHGVTAAGVSYLQLNGAWKKSPMTPQDNIKMSRENLHNAAEYSCKPMPDSVIGGVALVNFATHTDGDTVIDNTISIDKRTGLAVTVVTDMKEEKIHVVTQYAYGGIKPPM